MGQYIVKAIGNNAPQAEVRVLDLEPRRTFLNIESIPGVRIISADLRQPHSFAQAMAGVDTVIHSAGVISFKRGDKEVCRQSNNVALENLLDAAIAHGCGTLVNISSISAVCLHPHQLADETMFPDLETQQYTDPYGYSKRCGELLLQAHKNDIRAITLNPSVILGPGSDRISKVVQVLRWLPFCPMITTVNSFVDVRDVATAVVLALDYGRSGERYIVTTENIEMLTFAKMALALMGKKAPIFPVPKSYLSLFDFLVWSLDALHINPGFKNSTGFNVNKAYSNQKISQEMGWKPNYLLAESLRDTIGFCLGEKKEDKDEFLREDGIAYRHT